MYIRGLVYGGGFASVNFGKFIGDVLIKISHTCVDILEGKGGGLQLSLHYGLYE